MTKYSNKQLKEMQQVWKDEIAMRGPNKIRKDKKVKRIPMTIEEEYRNSGDPIPNDMLNASNSEKFKNKKND